MKTIPVTVVASRRARRRRRTAALRMIRRAFEGELAPPIGRLSAAVFQGLDDPDQFLYLAEWTDRARMTAYETAVRTPELEAVWEGPPQVWYCRALRPPSTDLPRAAAVAGAVVVGPDEAADAILEALLAAAPAGGQKIPGVLDYAIYQDRDAPGRLLLIRGWVAAVDLARVRAERSPAVEARLQALGASLTRFAARSSFVLGAGFTPP